ncbi:MAG: hypothetical protein KJ914_10595 [Gammaproteobacteria bacterium]|nr:hypothetical protein [Gammaproteobacteria bacterium]MBU1723898.1 hypothetical protein [Gammaproteobacteria bacterium]MBU2006193.1 hypothetical protein [Gammaproteobacteria bacterium]
MATITDHLNAAKRERQEAIRQQQLAIESTRLVQERLEEKKTEINNRNEFNRRKFAALQAAQRASSTAEANRLRSDAAYCDTRIAASNARIVECDRLIVLWKERAATQRANMQACNERAAGHEEAARRLREQGGSTTTTTNTLPLPDNIKAMVMSNPANAEGIYNSIVSYLMTRYPDYPDTLYALNSANTHPPAPGAIKQAYIHDAFKIMRDGLQIQGFEVQDNMPGTPFARDFNTLIGQANALIRTRNQNASRPFALLNTFDKLPHRDAFQLIPHWTSNYAGGALSNVEISDNSIVSSAQLQGVFASDGAFHNLRINNNRIGTPSAHQITIAGMLSGEIRNNKTLQGSALNNIELLPMRIGGGENVFVLSFHPSSSYQYRPIAGIAASSDKRQQKRTSVWNAKHYYNFRMDAFLAAYNEQAANTSMPGGERARLAAQLAPEFGTLVA